LRAVTLSLSDADFGNLVQGKGNAQRLFMSGKLKIKGDVMKATKLDPILKVRCLFSVPRFIVLNVANLWSANTEGANQGEALSAMLLHAFLSGDGSNLLVVQLKAACVAESLAHDSFKCNQWNRSCCWINLHNTTLVPT
jgi:uncharacterized protein YqgC (DUF456 family)